MRACGLSRQTFDNLVQANLQDQVVSEYPTYRDLLGYCALSAEPVGRIVLELFGVSTPERIELSDRICTALQLVEHWQDVAEDRRVAQVVQRFGRQGECGGHRERGDLTVDRPRRGRHRGERNQSGAPPLVA